MRSILAISCLLVTIVLGSVFTAVAQPELLEKVEAKPGEVKIAYEKWKMPNGLIVMIHEDHSDPICHIDVTYHVGSNREEIGKSGFAHFFEHMMFQGSENVGDEEHFQIVSAAGGTLNGTTNSDRTNYFETLPSNQLELALWLEADRMGFFLDAITKKKFEVQRDAVRNEKSQNVENQPYAIGFVEYLPRTLYPPGHPYSWPVIGYVDDLNRVKVDDLKDFFMRWYGPNNASLTVAGDVDPKEVLKLVEKYFGSIPAGPKVDKLITEPVILPVDQYVNYADNIYLPMTVMAFPTVPNYHRDEAALDVMADIMGDGNNSIFYKEFVKTEEAVQAIVQHPCRELAGELNVMVISYPDRTFSEVEEKIRICMDKFEAEITEDAVQRAKAKMEAQIVDGMSSVSWKAAQLASWNMLLNRPFNLDHNIKRYQKVSREDVVRVFKKYIKGKKAAIMNIRARDPMSKDSVKSVNPYANIKLSNEKPKLYAESGETWVYKKPADNFDRSSRPKPGESKKPVIPSYFTQNLSNGLNIIGTQTTEVPKVVIMLEIRGGDLVLNDVKKAGLASLTADLMYEGTQKMTTEEFSAALERLGSTIDFIGGRQSTTIYVESLTKNLDATLKLFEENLMQPRFNIKDFDRVKKQAVANLRNRKNDANGMAIDVYNALVYGEDNMWGAYATAKSLKKLSLDDVKEYYSKYYTPSQTRVVVVGDITEADAKAKLAFLEKWEDKKVTIPEMPKPVEPEETMIYIVHKPYSPQSVLRMGHVGLPYDAYGDYLKASITNFPLGGAFNSRINLNLREDKGFTYGIRSSFSGNEFPGTFTVGSSVKRAATDSAVSEIMMEINGYLKDGITDKELEFTKSSLLNSEALRYETAFQKTRFLSRILRYNLEKDYTDKQSAILKGMSKDDINAIAKKHIKPEKMIIVVAGNKYSIKKPLEKLKLGKVKEFSYD